MSEDVIADMKKTLFKMVNAIGDDRLPDKIEVKDKKVECSKVSRAEYLQVILIFIEECQRVQEYVNLP